MYDAVTSLLPAKQFNHCSSTICTKSLTNGMILKQGQLLEGVECHIYLYRFIFVDINLNRAFAIIVLFPKQYSNKKVCANGIRK